MDIITELRKAEAKRKEASLEVHGLLIELLAEGGFELLSCLQDGHDAWVLRISSQNIAVDGPAPVNRLANKEDGPGRDGGHAVGAELSMPDKIPATLPVEDAKVADIGHKETLAADAVEASAVPTPSEEADTPGNTTASAGPEVAPGEEEVDLLGGFGFPELGGAAKPALDLPDLGAVLAPIDAKPVDAKTTSTVPIAMPAIDLGDMEIDMVSFEAPITEAAAPKPTLEVKPLDPLDIGGLELEPMTDRVEAAKNSASGASKTAIAPAAENRDSIDFIGLGDLGNSGSGDIILSGREARPVLEKLPNEGGVAYLRRRAERESDGLRVKSSLGKRPNVFLSNSASSEDRAKRLARTLLSDITAYKAAEHAQALSGPSDEIMGVFAADVSNARTRYNEIVSDAAVPNRNAIFVNAVNDVLGNGQIILKDA